MRLVSAVILAVVLFSCFPLYGDNNIVRYFRDAESAFDKGEYSLAIAYYKRILSIRPFTKEAYNGLGKVYAALNRDDEALVFFQNAIRIDPNYIDCLNNLAWLHIEREEYDTSSIYIEEVIRREPDNSTALINKAFILLQKGDYRGARKLLEDIIDKHPKLGETYTYLANLLRDERSFKWTQSLTREWVDRKKLQRQMEKMEADIRRYYRTAIEFSKDPSFALIQYGTFLDELADEKMADGEYEKGLNLKREALDNLRKVKNTTENIGVLLLIAFLEADTGSDTEAVETLEMVLEKNPTHTIARYNNAWIQAVSGKSEEAISLLKGLRDIDPEDELARYLYEELLRKTKPVDFPDRLKLSREHIRIAKNYETSKKLRMALNHYFRSVRLTPQDPDSRREIATFYYKQKMFDRARFELAKLLELDPFNSAARDLRDFLRQDARLMREKSGLVGEPLPLDRPELPILVINFRTEEPSQNHWNGGDILGEILRNRIGQLEGYRVLDAGNWRLDLQVSRDSLRLEALIEELTVKHGARLVIWGTFREDGKRASAVYNIMDILSRKKLADRVVVSSGEGRIDNIVDGITGELMKTLSPPGKIYKIRKDEALVNLGRLHNVKKGSVLYVFRGIDKKIPHLDLRSSGERHERLRFIGYIKVTGAVENYSIGKISLWNENQKMELNDEVYLYGTLFPLDEDIRFRDSAKPGPSDLLTRSGE